MTNVLYCGGAYYFGERAYMSRLKQAALRERSAELVRKRELIAAQAVTIERLRTAHELHDVVAHHVSIMSVQAAAARTMLANDPNAAAGASVLFSSHQLEIVELLCDDLVIIADGSIRASGEREALRVAYSSPRYTITAGSDLGWLRAEPDITVVEFNGGHATFDTTEPAAAQRVLSRAVLDEDITTFAAQRASLSQIFREVI
jgi:thioesterase domain-containing protein